MRRVRAMELLKTLFVALSKNYNLKDTEEKVLSEFLRRKVIDTMLYMIRTYPFCSISHQQAILILNSLKDSFDQQDLAVMKKFVIVELEENREFNFPSGKSTSNMNMGQIIQIAFELRNITQAALDDESSSADESEAEDQ